MNIIIAGTGEVGFYLSKLLAQESHNIVIIGVENFCEKLIKENSVLLLPSSVYLSVNEQVYN